MMKSFGVFRLSGLAALSSSVLVSLACSSSPVEAPGPGRMDRPVTAPVVRAASTADIAAFKRALEPHLSRSTSDLPVIRGPDGRRRIDLQGRFGSGHVLRIEPDGTTRIECVTSVAELDRVVSGERTGR